MEEHIGVGFFFSKNSCRMLSPELHGTLFNHVIIIMKTVGRDQTEVKYDQNIAKMNNFKNHEGF